MLRAIAHRLARAERAGRCSLGVLSAQQRQAHAGFGLGGASRNKDDRRPPRLSKSEPPLRQRGGFGLSSGKTSSSQRLSGSYESDPWAEIGSSKSSSSSSSSSSSTRRQPWSEPRHDPLSPRYQEASRRQPFGFRSSGVERERLPQSERVTRREGIRYKSEADKPAPEESEQQRPSRSFDDLITGEIRTSLLREDVLARAKAANTVIDSTTQQTVTTVPSETLGAAGDLDTFFSGFEDPVEASEVALPKLTPPPAVAAKPLATYIAPTESGVALIKRFMQEHKFLTTKQIWELGTDGLKPRLPQTIAFEADGRIKMKRVSTMREGRRPWVPPKEPSFPDHPFRSVRFLKETILASLEDSGVIHKASVQRPLETEEEHQEAIRKVESQNRKAERRHIHLGLPPPLMRMPATTKQVWGWLPGPKYKGMTPLQVKLEKQREYNASKQQAREEAEASRAIDLPPHLASAPTPEESSKPRFERERPSEVDENGIHYGWHSPPHIEEAVAAEYEFDQDKWNRAAQAEFQYHYLKLREAEAIAERQAVRRAKAKEQREAEKLQHEEDIATGAIEALKKEERRMEALKHIEAYAKETGQDVSGWFEELSEGEVGESPDYVPQHQIQGGAIPRGRDNSRRRMRPLGFPIN